ncbi:hypothetical protein L1987_16913 [Smallanthus sonchifolius]|uniref:Uncharacterized protein n=1 Tax=Smallanthus sonchifolius TaxID=185202 RepID=A0ACB9IXN0_9ASTR|nr:hypothetical protein L1987_16913 [Smallanthus sonchifolius]
MKAGILLQGMPGAVITPPPPHPKLIDGTRALLQATLSNYSRRVANSTKASHHTKSPSKSWHVLQDKCATYGKTAFPLEKWIIKHTASHVSSAPPWRSLSPSNYAALEGNNHRFSDEILEYSQVANDMKHLPQLWIFALMRL